MQEHTISGLAVVLGICLIAADSTCGQSPATHDTVQTSFTAKVAAVNALRAEVYQCPWLQAAIDVSRELPGMDVEPESEELKGEAAAAQTDKFPDGETSVWRFPLQVHVTKYLEVRPWSWYYATSDVRRKSTSGPKHQPGLMNAAGLRERLRDEDAAIRAMAAEALATLQQPEDVERIGQMLDDKAAAAPVLGHNRVCNTR